MVTQLPRMIARVNRTPRLESSIEEDWPQPYKVELKYHEIEKRQEIYDWCSEKFGKHTEQWNNPRWCSNIGYYSYWFKKERDRTMFLMRWS